MKARLIAALVTCIVALSGAASAQAQEGTTRGPGGIRDTSPQSRPQDLSVMLYAPWWYGIGIGAMARYEIPIVPDGFIPSINDQFSIEPALGIGYQSAYCNYCGERGFITPAVYATWSFHITSKFRPYAAVGLGAVLGIDGDDDYGGNQHNFFIDTSVGLFYRFSQALSFRGELGAWGPKAGLAFYF